MSRRTKDRPSELGKWSLAILALVLLAGGAGAGLPVQVIGRSEGLPSAQVHAVVEAGDGFMWFAGPSGLARYDGWRVKTFGTADGLTSQGLRALALGHDRRLWVGTDLGVDVREADGRIHPLLDAEPWTYGFVDDLAAGPERTMWIAAARGLLRWSEHTGLQAVADENLRDRHVTSITADAAGRIWAAVPSVGLLRHDGQAWSRVQPPGLELAGAVRALAPSEHGGLLVGGDDGLVELDASGSAAPVIGAAFSGLVGAVLATADELWVGAGGELHAFKRRAKVWRAAATVADTGLINDFTVDRLGNVWAATDKVGAVKISALRHAVQSPPAPCRAQVFAIARGAGDAYLVGGDQCSWIIGEDGRIHQRLAGLDRVKVWDILRDRHGTLWAATEQGLYRGSEGRAMAPSALASESLSAPGRVLLDRGDALWVGTVTGLVEIAGDRVSERPGPGGQPLGYVYTLELGPRGLVWAGTIGNGLWRETPDGSFERATSDLLTATGNVYSLAFGPGGRMVVAQDDRLVILDGAVSTLLPSATGDAVAAWSLLFDPQGGLWVGGSSGLVRYDLENRTPTLRLVSTMGLSGGEFTSSRSLLATENGRLLCGLDGGLTIVGPAELQRLQEPPEVKLLDVEWANAEVEASPRATTVSEGRWTLEAAVAAPWYIDEKSISYRHRARGFDAGWSHPQAGASHRIHYTGLPPGTYTLEAQAHSPLAGWGPAVDLLTLEVTPPWWRRWWALTLGLAMVAAASATLDRWRTRVLLQRSRELERQVEQRTQELETALAEVQHIAAHDELTGLPNQRAFWEHAQQHQALAKRNGTELALVVMDLDNFKLVNDSHGHRVGDRLLAEVAQRLLGVARESDLLARYGGEEFVVLMPGTPEPAAVQGAERLRTALERSPFSTPEGIELKVTGSFGVSCLRGPADDVEALFQRADSAVYLAKRTKNVVAVWAGDRLPANGKAGSTSA